MSQRVWCEASPRDCAQLQRLQEREWLHSRAMRVSVFDVAAAVAIVAAVMIGLF